LRGGPPARLDEDEDEDEEVAATANAAGLRRVAAGFAGFVARRAAGAAAEAANCAAAAATAERGMEASRVKEQKTVQHEVELGNRTGNDNSVPYCFLIVYQKGRSREARACSVLAPARFGG